RILELRVLFPGQDSTSRQCGGHRDAHPARKMDRRRPVSVPVRVTATGTARLDTSMSLLLLALLGWSLASCTRLVAYHTVAPTSPAATTGPTCEPETNTWTVRDECRSLIAERSQEYQLFFAEFDDQGWPFDAPRYGAAGQQIPIFIDNLRREVTDSPRGVSIV